MKRVSIAEMPAEGDEVALSAPEAHHLLHVLRAKNEETISWINGKGAHGLAHLHITGKNKASINITQVILAPPLSPLYLVAGLTKPPAVDEMIEKATAFGVTGIFFYQAHYSPISYADGASKKRQERWQKTAWSACKQSGNPTLPTLKAYANLECVLSELQLQGVRLFMGSKEGGATPLSQIGREPLAMIVGSEAGFSKEELNLMQQANVKPINAGPYVLRSPTAVAALLGIVRFTIPATQDTTPSHKNNVAP